VSTGVPAPLPNRSLINLICCVALVETAFFVMLAPILSELVEDAHASHTQAGILTAAYAGGSMVGALPAGLLVWKVGARLTVIAGLVLLSAATLCFGFLDGIWLLDASRFLQGIGGALAWTSGLAWLTEATGPERRGAAIGLVMSAALVGALVGPVLGAAAAQLGRAWVLSTFSVLGAGLVVWTLRLEERSAERRPGFVDREARRSLRHPDVLGGLWLVFIAGFFFGVLAVIAPLALSDVGLSAVWIGAVFLVAAAVEAVLNPLLGRWYDEGGRVPLIRLTLVSSAAIAFLLPVLSEKWVLATGVALAAIAFGSFWLPGTAVLASGVEATALAPAVGFALWTFAWAPANVVGALVSGWLSDATGDAVPYVLVGVISLLTLATTVRQEAAVAT
jgi:predicted MFS family arabinose efflux permease